MKETGNRLIKGSREAVENGENNPSGKNSDNLENTRSCLGTLFAFLGVVISALWMLNLGFGIIEIPDNIPIIGNLDEAFFMTLLWVSLAYFGIEIPFVRRILERRRRK